MPSFTKDIVPLGTHHIRNRKGEFVPTDISEQRANRWINNFHRQRQKGFMIPAPLEHDLAVKPIKNLDDLVNPDNNGGFWESLFLEDRKDEEGNEFKMLVGIIDSEIENAKELIGNKVKGCSLFADDFVDNEGTDHGDSVQHICLTNKPVAPTDNFKENTISIAMSSSYRGKESDIPCPETASKFQSIAEALQSVGGVSIPTDVNSVPEFLNLVLVGINALSKGVLGGSTPLSHSPMSIIMSSNSTHEETLDDFSKLSKEDLLVKVNHYQSLYKKKTKDFENLTVENKSLKSIFVSSEKQKLETKINSLKESLKGDKDKLGIVESFEKQLKDLTLEINSDGTAKSSELEKQVDLMVMMVPKADSSKKTDDPNNTQEPLGNSEPVAPPTSSSSSYDDSTPLTDEEKSLLNSLYV